MNGGRKRVIHQQVVRLSGPCRERTHKHSRAAAQLNYYIKNLLLRAQGINTHKYYAIVCSCFV